MDEAIRFIEDYLEKEFSTQWSRLGDPQEIFQPKIIELNTQYFSRDVRNKSGIVRGTSTTPEEIEAMRPFRDKLKKRRPLEASEFEGGPYGKLYRFTVTGSEDYGGLENAPSLMLFAAPVDGAMKIVSRYRVCPHCGGTGKLPDGDKCGDCKGAGWFNTGGLELDVRKPGKPLGTRELGG
jgi:hypothetical protein